MTSRSGPVVSLQALNSYQQESVERALGQLLQPWGGMQYFVRPGQRVLLKPNMLAGKNPELAVTTHPALVRAVAVQVQAAGGIVSLGDSPGIGSPAAVARKCGLQEVVEELGIRFAPFSESVAVNSPRGTFHQLEIARDILETDLIINLPKLKTHQMMGLTCAVKNLFGAVVGLRKPRLHLQAGTDKAFFALMLLDLCDYLAPALTIVDAVVGMEGDGPGSGDPVPIGALLAGELPLAIDTAALELVGMKTDQVWTQQQARATGRPGTRLEELDLRGTPLAQLKLTNFRPAKKTDVNFGLPKPLKGLLRSSLSARPEPASTCQLCGLCIDHCPADAMHIEEQRLIIDKKSCIRCFCCQELCPHGALLTRQGLLLRLHQLIGPRH